MSSIMEAMKKTLAEIDEILAKSSYMKKNEDNSSKEEQSSEEQSSEEQSSEEQSSEEQSSEEQSAQISDKQEKPQKERSSEKMESIEDQEDLDTIADQDEESIEKQAKDLSDEELDTMLEILKKEKESRSLLSQDKAKPESSEDDIQASIKEDYAKMHKSMESLVEMVSSIKSELADLKSEKAKNTTKTISKASASNVKDVQVLEKSYPAKKRLSKSETLTFLEGQIRKKNPLVNSSLIAEVNLANEQELIRIQDRLEVEGLQFPTK